ncbi:hypothetical protein WJX82_001813 [Trebouxia sp. C0006]
MTETLIPVKSNCGSKEYCEWWKQHQHDPKLFGAQLIGETATPQKFAGMSFSDLSFFCDWGRKRVTDFEAIAGPLQLILPVLTSPQLAVSGIYNSTITLSWSNVEPILVMANSIGLECLEDACHNFFDQCFPLPEAPFSVHILEVEKKGDQTHGCYLLPKDAKRFVDVARSFKVFAVHPSPPYIRQCLTIPYASLKDLQVGRQFGWPAFLKTTKKAYPAKYMGPFILGIWWQAPEKGRQVPDMQWLFT